MVNKSPGRRAGFCCHERRLPRPTYIRVDGIHATQNQLASGGRPGARAEGWKEHVGHALAAAAVAQQRRSSSATTRSVTALQAALSSAAAASASDNESGGDSEGERRPPPEQPLPLATRMARRRRRRRRRRPPPCRRLQRQPATAIAQHATTRAVRLSRQRCWAATAQRRCSARAATTRERAPREASASAPATRRLQRPQPPRGAAHAPSRPTSPKCYSLHSAQPHIRPERPPAHLQAVQPERVQTAWQYRMWKAEKIDCRPILPSHRGNRTCIDVGSMQQWASCLYSAALAACAARKDARAALLEAPAPRGARAEPDRVHLFGARR